MCGTPRWPPPLCWTTLGCAPTKPRVRGGLRAGRPAAAVPAISALRLVPCCATTSVLLIAMPAPSLAGCLHNWELDMSTVTTTPEVRALPTFQQLSHLSAEQVGCWAGQLQAVPASASRRPRQRLAGPWCRAEHLATQAVLVSACAASAERCAPALPIWLHSRSTAQLTAPSLGLLPHCQVAWLWKNYFVFSVTRDPLERAVSQYNFLLRSNLADPPGCADAVRCAGCSRPTYAGGLLGGGSAILRGSPPQALHTIAPTRSLAAAPPSTLHCPLSRPAPQAEALDWDAFCESPPSLAKFCARRPDCCKQVSGCPTVMPGQGCLKGADAPGRVAGGHALLYKAPYRCLWLPTSLPRCPVHRLRGCTMASAGSWRTLCRRRSALPTLLASECGWGHGCRAALIHTRFTSCCFSRHLPKASVPPFHNHLPC